MSSRKFSQIEEQLGELSRSALIFVVEARQKAVGKRI
jgi:hypothetical protein